MKSSELASIAKECTAEQLVGLLKEWGDTKFYDQWGSHINNGSQHIKVGAEKSSRRTRKEKKSIVNDYFAKQGAFAEKQDVPDNKAEALQQEINALNDKVRELIEAKQELTERVDALETHDKQVQEILEILLKVETGEQGDNATPDDQDMQDADSTVVTQQNRMSSRRPSHNSNLVP